MRMLSCIRTMNVITSCSVTRMLFFFSSRRRHTSLDCDWSSAVCSSDLEPRAALLPADGGRRAGTPARLACLPGALVTRFCCRVVPLPRRGRRPGPRQEAGHLVVLLRDPLLRFPQVAVGLLDLLGPPKDLRFQKLALYQQLVG